MTAAAGGPFFSAATKIRIGRGRSLSRQPLQAEPFFSAATKIRIGHGPRCRNNCCRRNHSPLASIRKSGLEIKNRCTPRAKSREKFAAIPNSDSRIKNRCSKGHQNSLQPKTISSSPPAQGHQPKPSKFIRERNGLSRGRVERHGASPLPQLIRKNSRQLSALLRIFGRQIVRLPDVLPQII